MSRCFFKIEALGYIDQILTVELVELRPMAPDGLIGTPWGITEASNRCKVRFLAVVAFCVEPEIANSLGSSVQKIEPFLFRQTCTDYTVKMGWAASMYVGLPSETVQTHFVVYSENLVVHVLTPNQPEILAHV